MDEQKSKQPRFKRGMRAHMWSPFMRDEDSESDDEFVGSVIGVDDTDMSITAYHLVQILLKLLLSLGELDMNHNVRGRTLSATILPSLLYFLSQFRPEGSHVNGTQKTEKWLNSHNQSNNNRLDGHVHNETSAYVGAFARESSTSLRTSETDEAGADGGEDVEAVPWQGDEKVLLLRQVVRTVLTLSAIVATQQNGVRILMHLKVVDHLLDL